MDRDNKKDDAKSKLLPILIFTAVIVGVGLYGFLFLNQEDNIIQGEADITDVRISSKVPGRIARFYVDEGMDVKKGDTLAILSIPDLDAKLTQAQASKDGAYAQHLKAIKGAREEKKRGAYEMWQKSIAGLDIAKKSYDRIQNLFEKGVATAQKRDEAEAQYKSAIATEQSAKSQYDMAKNGTEYEDKLSALAMVDKAEGAIVEVKSYIDESYLISPVDGRVHERFPHVGELVGTGAPIFNIMQLDDKWGSFNVIETKLVNYKINDTFTAYVPALDREVQMKIYYIKDLGTYGAWKATKSTGQYDRKTFEVKARFMNDDMNDVIPGMSLIVKEK